jgi:hypothetical protein
MTNENSNFLKQDKGLAQGEERTSSEIKGTARAEEESNLSCPITVNRVPSCQIKLFRFYSPPGHGREVGRGLTLCDEPASPQRLVEDIKW